MKITEEIVDNAAREEKSNYSSAKLRSSEQLNDYDFEKGRYDRSFTTKKINLDKPLVLRETKWPKSLNNSFMQGNGLEQVTDDNNVYSQHGIQSI